MPSITEEAVAAGRGFGRYFSVVGIVPSLVGVVWLLFLVAGGAWSGRFDPDQSIATFGGLDAANIGALIAAAVVVGLIINPFQFTVTQWLEGYWGGSHLASRIAALRINRYRQQMRSRALRGDLAEGRLIRAALRIENLDSAAYDDLLREALYELEGTEGDALIYLDQERRYRDRFLHRFPTEFARVMPTRFGNALRAFEDNAGRQYGLDVTVVAPHLDLLEDNPRSSYVQDTRQTMDLAVRLFMVAIFATPASAVLLADDGAWVLLALAPYSVAYLAYRGAVSCAQAYGNAVTYQIDLDRFSLYQALRLPMPKNSSTERRQNRQVMTLLRGARAHVRYVHPLSNEDTSKGESSVPPSAVQRGL